MFTAALFTTAKGWKQQMNRLRCGIYIYIYIYTHTMEYYSAIKEKKIIEWN